MAMPAGYDGMRTDDASERTDDVDSYRAVCMDYIKEISHDYIAWVERYKLPRKEDDRRRAEIAGVIERTNLWIAKVPQSIKGVDVAMNDGIQKMAEATAGHPFYIDVQVNGQSSYVVAQPGNITARVRARGRLNRKTVLGFHFKDNWFRIESTCNAAVDESILPFPASVDTDIPLTIHAKGGKPLDVISFTVTVIELDGELEHEKRGVSTIIHLE